MPKGDGNRGKGARLAWLKERMEYDGEDCLIWPGSLTAIRLSTDHARKLAEEIADMQLDYKITEAEILASLLSGTSRFMDLPVTVVP